MDPFDVVQADLVVTPAIELGGARRGVIGDSKVIVAQQGRGNADFRRSGLWPRVFAPLGRSLVFAVVGERVAVFAMPASGALNELALSAQSVSKRVAAGNLTTDCRNDRSRLVDCGTTNGSQCRTYSRTRPPRGLHARIAFITVSEPSTLITRFML